MGLAEYAWWMEQQRLQRLAWVYATEAAAENARIQREVADDQALQEQLLLLS